MMNRILASCAAFLGVTSAACADNGNDVGYLTKSIANGGVTATGGSSGTSGSGPAFGGIASASGGSPNSRGTGGSSGNPPGAGGTAGVNGSGGAGAPSGSGGSAGAGGCASPADCPQPGGICSAATCVANRCGIANVCVPDGGPQGSGGSGGAPVQQDSGAGGGFMCGSLPCLPTTCVGPGCGIGRCCQTDGGPVCVHGSTPCPGEIPKTTLQCWSDPTLATFTKSCTTPADCFVARHYTGCCAVSAVGLATTEQSSFNSFEQACGGVPPCGCCCDSVSVEEGLIVPASTNVVADCWAGMCVTRVQ
jgi:hypothetical protein